MLLHLSNVRHLCRPAGRCFVRRRCVSGAMCAAATRQCGVGVWHAHSGASTPSAPPRPRCRELQCRPVYPALSTGLGNGRRTRAAPQKTRSRGGRHAQVQGSASPGDAPSRSPLLVRACTPSNHALIRWGVKGWIGTLHRLPGNSCEWNGGRSCQYKWRQFISTEVAAVVSYSIVKFWCV